MRPRTCFVPAALLDLTQAAAADLPERVSHYLTRVLRLPPGSPLLLRDPLGRSLPATLQEHPEHSEHRGHWQAAPSGPLTQPDLSSAARSVWLAPALIKGHRLDWLLEKATELGADRIGLTQTTRSVVRWSADDFLRKRPRLEQQLEAAATQSGAALPLLDPPATLAERAAAWSAEGARLLVADPTASSSLRDAIHDAPTVALFCGPEGGFTPDEVASLSAAGALAINLGPRILRAETASIALLAAIRLTQAGGPRSAF